MSTVDGTFGYGFGGNRFEYPPTTTASSSIGLAASPEPDIRQAYSPTLAGELERLFITEAPKTPTTMSTTSMTSSPVGPYWDIRARTRHGSSSDSGISEEFEPDPIPFHANGVESDVDEFDLKLLYQRSTMSPTNTMNSPTSVMSSTSNVPLLSQAQSPPFSLQSVHTRSRSDPMTMDQIHMMLTRRNRHGYPRKDKNECTFCKNNGEASFIYSSHILKDDNGRIMCPILRVYECPNCGATGDKAHTLKYCPLSGTEAVASLRTARTSTGRRRFPRPTMMFPDRYGRRPPPSQLLSADKFQKVMAPLL